MEQMHVVQHQVVRHVHQLILVIVQHDQVVVVVVKIQMWLMQHIVDVGQAAMDHVTFQSHIDVERTIL